MPLCFVTQACKDSFLKIFFNFFLLSRHMVVSGAGSWACSWDHSWDHLIFSVISDGENAFIIFIIFTLASLSWSFLCHVWHSQEVQLKFLSCLKMRLLKMYNCIPVSKNKSPTLFCRGWPILQPGVAAAVLWNPRGWSDVPWGLLMLPVLLWVPCAACQVSSHS